MVGVGAIGSAFAAELWKAERRELLFCVRRALAQWVVERDHKATVMTPRVATQPDALQPAEWVLLCTKAHETASAAPWLERLVGPETAVAVLQNGVDPIERVAPYVRGAPILPAVVQCPAQRVAPGHVVVHAPPQLVVPDGELAHRFAALFAGSDAVIACREDFATPLWEKLCMNAIGSVSAIVDAPLDLRDEGLADLARAMLREIVLVARAEGAKLEDEVVERMVRHYSRGGGRPNSILLDRRAGRPLEHEARNAVIVRRARMHGIDVPVNAAVAALLRAISANANA